MFLNVIMHYFMVIMHYDLGVVMVIMHYCVVHEYLSSKLNMIVLFIHLCTTFTNLYKLNPTYRPYNVRLQINM